MRFYVAEEFVSVLSPDQNCNRCLCLACQAWDAKAGDDLECDVLHHRILVRDVFALPIAT